MRFVVGEGMSARVRGVARPDSGEAALRKHLSVRLKNSSNQKRGREGHKKLILMLSSSLSLRMVSVFVAL